MRTVMLFHAAYLVLQFPKAKKIIASDSQTIFTCPQDVSHFYFLLSHRHTHTHTHTHTTNTQTHSLPHRHTPLLTLPTRTNTIVIDCIVISAGSLANVYPQSVCSYNQQHN